MCGIAAIFNYATGEPVNRSEMGRMLEHMRRRGPDGSGEWYDTQNIVGLGHRRLSIIDLSAAGAQPMAGTDGSCIVTFNGEIYNYRELRSGLEARGRRFRSDSDTEVLLHLYAEHGEAMVEKLRGMYAFAIWDSNKRSLFLARDPFGIKPLYWSDDGKTFRVASQVKALLAGGGVDRSPEPAGHVGFFLWGHVPGPYTLFRGIRSLPAGHSLTITAGGKKERRNFGDIAKWLSEAETQEGAASGPSVPERLRQALRDSVRHHLIADVPVGVFLSAGLDSATIAALASESGGELRTITLGFEEFKGTANDETALASEVAGYCGTNHQTLWVRRQDFAGDLARLLQAMDQPSSDGVNSYFVSKAAARTGLKAALSGVGGDELFGGYPSFREVPSSVSAIRPLSIFPAFGRALRAVSAPVLKRMTSPKYAGVLEYGGTYGGAYLLRRGMFMPWELPEILDADLVREGWNELQTLARLDAAVRGIRSPHLKVSALEMGWYMRNQLLCDTDWASMDHSLEVRVPLVDVELLRQVAPLIPGKPSPTKRDMALTPSRPLPPAILERSKTGFHVPIRRWLMESQQAAELGNRKPDERGLRGWARLVYHHFAGETGLGCTCPEKTLSPGRGSRPDGRQKPAQTAPAQKNILVLLSDAYGGFGGIAKFNRDLLEAVCADSSVGRVLAIPRIIREPIQSLPGKLEYVTAAANHKSKFVMEFVRQVRAFHRTHGVDMIICAHVNLLPAAFLARSWLMGGRNGHGSHPPIVLMIHGIDAWERTSKPLVNYFAKQADALVAVSGVTQQRFASWAGISPGKSFVLPNCVEFSHFAAGRKSEALLRRYQLQDRKVLLTFGRLHPDERYKGIDEVLDVLGDLKQQIPNLSYLIVGEGGDRARLEAKAAGLGLQECVVFAGRIAEEEKAEHYRLADVYVMPGRGEGFGIVYLEALACGIPVIASKADGSREAVRDGALGQLVDPGNPEEIKAAILRALQTVPEPEFRRPPAGLEYFSYENFEKRCHEILEKVWNRN